MLNKRKISRVVLTSFITVLISGSAMAIEEPGYEVTHSAQDYELRLYADYLVAETEVEGSYFRSGNRAFRILADYIFGNNSASRKMAMTAPVESAESKGVKMAMTAPVESRQTQAGQDKGRTEKYIYGFVMEDHYTLETLPQPNNPSITIRRVPKRTVAVHRYSGRGSKSNYEKHEKLLLKALERDGVRVTGAPKLARFNGPMTPWFLRRNEVQVAVDSLVTVRSP